MSFWDHVEVLRGTLFRSVLAVGLLSLVFLFIPEPLFKAVLWPTRPDFILYSLLGLDFGIDLINVDLSAQFFVHLKVSLLCGAVLGFPFVVWEIWKFIAPALYENERKAVRTAFGLSSGLFYLGVAVGYFLVLPACVQFFLNYSVSPEVTNSITIGSYMSMFTSTVLMIGVAFEFPTVIWLLSKMGILTREQLRKGRRYAVVIVLTIAAIVTPADPLSMLIVATPLYLLYEIAILLCSKSAEKPEESESAA